MCGLAGFCVQGVVSNHDIKVLALIREELVKAAARRGTDSYGGVFLDGDGKHMQVIRGLGSIVPQVARIPLRGQAVMLHTRSKTTGDVSVRNAHPFSHKGILGMHNGAVSNFWSLKNKDSADYRVDSEALIARIGKGEDASDVEAWGAVTWVSESSPSEGVYLCRFSGGSLDALTGKLPSGTLCSVWASVMPSAVPKNLLEAQPWIVESGRVFQIRDGQVGVTARSLRVGEKVTKTVYHSKRLESGPNGEKYQDWAVCTCDHEFSRHNAYTVYGGMCVVTKCPCMKYTQDEKATNEIKCQREERAKKLAEENKNNPAQAVTRTAVVEKRTCTCGHDQFGHKKGKKACFTLACPCNKFSLGTYEMKPSPIQSKSAFTSTAEASRARWEAICDAETGDELRKACWSIIEEETGVVTRDKCPEKKCDDTHICGECCSGLEEMKGTYRLMMEELQKGLVEGEVQYERTTQPGAGQTTVPAKTVAESPAVPVTTHCGACGRIWEECSQEFPTTCRYSWRIDKAKSKKFWCIDCDTFWKSGHAVSCKQRSSTAASVKDKSRDSGPGQPADISAKLEALGAEAAKSHQERMGRLASSPVGVDKPPAPTCGHDICKLNMACLPGHCPTKREHPPSPTKRSLS